MRQVRAPLKGAGLRADTALPDCCRNRCANEAVWPFRSGKGLFTRQSRSGHPMPAGACRALSGALEPRDLWGCCVWSCPEGCAPPGAEAAGSLSCFHSSAGRVSVADALRQHPFRGIVSAEKRMGSAAGPFCAFRGKSAQRTGGAVSPGRGDGGREPRRRRRAGALENCTGCRGRARAGCRRGCSIGGTVCCRRAQEGLTALKTAQRAVLQVWGLTFAVLRGTLGAVLRAG